MVIEILFYILLFYAWVIFLYSIYKVIWYTVKMLAFGAMMKSLGKDRVRVERLRNLFDIVFGSKGDPDYYVTVGDKRYEVSVLSFISIHGRWIIENRTSGMHIEARRVRDLIYSEKKHRSVAGSPHEYKQEFRISRKELSLTPVEEEYAMQILLVYPTPKRITCVDHQYREIRSGDLVEGHTVMNVHDFSDLVHKET